jgi:hypothetical protein
MGSRPFTYAADACTITLARYRQVASPAPRATCAAISRWEGRARGVKRGPAGGRGSIRSTRKVRHASRSVSQAIRYQRCRSLTRRYGIHFLHVRSGQPGAKPLLITHGFPSSVAEFSQLIEPLVNLAAGQAFHVVAPSLPGYAFSTPLSGTGWTMGRTARAWAELMRQLGYQRYGVHGGDRPQTIGYGLVAMEAPADLAADLRAFFGPLQ